MSTKTLTGTVRARIDENIKLSAEKVLAAIGMDTSEAIRLFFNQIANRQEFPLELRVPNAVTIAAMNAEVESMEFSSTQSMFDHILNEDADDDYGTNEFNP